jgi:hypothetical protein
MASSSARESEDFCISELERFRDRDGREIDVDVEDAGDEGEKGAFWTKGFRDIEFCWITPLLEVNETTPDAILLVPSVYTPGFGAIFVNLVLSFAFPLKSSVIWFSSTVQGMVNEGDKPVWIWKEEDEDEDEEDEDEERVLEMAAVCDAVGWGIVSGVDAAVGCVIGTDRTVEGGMALITSSVILVGVPVSRSKDGIPFVLLNALDACAAFPSTNSGNNSPISSTWPLIFSNNGDPNRSPMFPTLSKLTTVIGLVTSLDRIGDTVWLLSVVCEEVSSLSWNLSKSDDSHSWKKAESIVLAISGAVEIQSSNRVGDVKKPESSEVGMYDMVDALRVLLENVADIGDDIDLEGAGER